MAKTLEDIQRSILIGSDPASDDDNKFDQAINVGIMKTNEDFNPTQSQIQERVKYIKRGHESALMNDTTRSSVVIRHDGQINISANRYAQFKLNPSGKIIEEALESVQLSNRHKIQTDDMVINEHKLNPYLYELTDMKKLASAYNDEMYVGNFCLFGSVLTKSWDMNLKRYVLIRRPARMPMFSTVLNVPEINTGLGISDPLKIDETLLAKSTKGYQVNAVISDANSLIGKEGQFRGGAASDNMINFNDGSEPTNDTSATGTNTASVTDMPALNSTGANDEVPEGDIPSSVPYGDKANGVAKVTGLKIATRPRLIWAQMAFETGDWVPQDGKPYWGLADHNYAGIKGKGRTISTEGDTYRYYESDEEFFKDYAKEIRLHDKWQREHNYSGVPVGDAKTAYQYAAAMKFSGYYGSPLSNYAVGLAAKLQKIPSQ